MLARPFRSHAVGALATLTMMACASGAGPMSQRYVSTARVPSLTPTSRVLDAERIRRSGAQTASDAIRLLVPGYRLQSLRGSSLRLFAPAGTRSFDSSMRIMIDGHRVGDLDALNVVPVHEIIAIHLLNETEASMYFGSGPSGGAIVVQTSVMLPRP